MPIPCIVIHITQALLIRITNYHFMIYSWYSKDGHISLSAKSIDIGNGSNATVGNHILSLSDVTNGMSHSPL
jgi:hypothetical protein